MSLLFGPSKSPLTESLDHAFSPAASIEDFATHLEICDIVNESEKGPKDAVYIIKKKLNSKLSPPTALKVLSVLECCVKNCGRRFHLLIGTKDFLTVYIKHITGPGAAQVASVVREKMLHMLQSWADAFRNDPELAPIPQIYKGLIKQGVEFPAQDLSALSPITTPQAAPGGGGTSSGAADDDDFKSQVESDEEFARRLAQQLQQEERSNSTPHAPTTGAPPDVPMVVQELGPNERVAPSERQSAEIRGQLKCVDETATLLAELINNFSGADFDFLVQVTGTCNAMHERITSLIGHVDDEALIVELLRANDTLTTQLTRCQHLARDNTAVADAFVRNPSPPSLPVVSRPVEAPEPAPAPTTTATPQPMRQPSEAATAVPSYSPPSFPGMADIGTALPSASAQEPPPEADGLEEEFDMFAQSRAAFDERKSQASEYVHGDFYGSSGLAGAMQASSSRTPYVEPEVEEPTPETSLLDEGPKVGKPIHIPAPEPVKTKPTRPPPQPKVKPAVVEPVAPQPQPNLLDLDPVAPVMGFTAPLVPTPTAAAVSQPAVPEPPSSPSHRTTDQVAPGVAAQRLAQMNEKEEDMFGL